MNRTRFLIFSTIAAFAVTACQPASNTTSNNAVVTNMNASSNSNSNANTANTAPAPTKEALVTLERSAFDAWKNKDAKFWDTFLATNFVGIGNNGKIDKAAAAKEYSGADCDVKSSTISDEQMTPLGPNAALLTYKLAQDATCGGKKLPANAWAAGVYVREGSQWKGAFHAEAAIPDPNAKASTAAASVKPAATAPTSAAPDAATEAMFTLEKKAWDDWKNKDEKSLTAWASPNLLAFTANGRQNAADAIKTWVTDGCEVKSTTLTDPSSVSLGPEYGLLLFHASVDGNCKGTAIPPEFGASIYGKEAGTWKALFTMGSSIL